MSHVYYASDLHVGHPSIVKYRQGITSEADNVALIEHHWYSLITKRDKVILLGDTIFHSDHIEWLDSLPGIKEYLIGNHCLQFSGCDFEKLHPYFKVHAFKKKGRFWLSHAPIHDTELRGRRNIHGHDHKGAHRGSDYINVNLDVILPLTGSIFLQSDQINPYAEQLRSRRD